MREDSPPFIRFRQPAPAGDPYALALAFAADAARVIERTPARVHVRDRLDRLVTAIVVEMARASGELASRRWRHAREALRWARDCAALLDLVAAQGAPGQDVAAARSSAQQLIAALAPVAGLAT